MKNLRWLMVFAIWGFVYAGCGGGGGGGGGTGDGGGTGNGGGTDPTPVIDSTINIVELAGFGGDFSAGVAINAGGLAVGFSHNGTSIKGAKWTVTAAAPAATALEPLVGNTYSAAYGVNIDDVAVGESGDTVGDVADANTVAVFWNADGVVDRLPAPDGNLGTYAAYSINGFGQVVGESVNDADGNTIAVLWDGASPTATATSLHQDGWEFSAAYFIHDDGIIVGEAKPTNGPLQDKVVGVIWTPAAAGTFVATLLPPSNGDAASVAFGVDGQGRIVGESEADNGSVRGMIWTVNILGTVITATETLADNTSLQAINDVNRIVGYTAALTGSDRAALWNATNLTDAKNLADVFSHAYGLNDSDQIVGFAGGQAFAAIPE